MFWISLGFELDVTYDELIYKFYKYVVMLTALVTYISLSILKYHQRPHDYCKTGAPETVERMDVGSNDSIFTTLRKSKVNDVIR